MSLETRLFLNWDEAATCLGLDSEGLRQALEVKFSNNHDGLWLPVNIDSRGRDFLARLEANRFQNPIVQEARVGEYHGEDRDTKFEDGTVFPSEGATDSSSWSATHDHRTGWNNCFLLGGRLTLSPETVKAACQDKGDLRPHSLRVAPREWCTDGFPDDGLTFSLVGGRPGFLDTPECLFDDVFFYSDDVRTLRARLDGQREFRAVSNSKWPWGAHDTALLEKLSEAASRFWSLYDPSDNSTAPTNVQVASWLIKQGVAKRTADVMASILRADGLPTGPRK